MARITIQDCLDNNKIINHFELSVLASNRAKDIMSGAPLTIETNNDKSPVLALREIAGGTIDCDVLRTKLYQKFQMIGSFSMELEEDNIGSNTESFLPDSLPSNDVILEEEDFIDEDQTLDNSEKEFEPSYSYNEENFDDNIDESVNDNNFTRRPF